MSVYVDIPTVEYIGPDGAFKHVQSFKTRREAIAFCQEHFGADEEGRVSLVSGEDDHICCSCGEPCGEDATYDDKTDSWFCGDSCFRRVEDMAASDSSP